MKALIVYYSLEGNTKLIADSIKVQLGCDALHLKPEKDIPQKGFLKYVWGGKQVIFNQKPKLMPFNVDFNQYDMIIIGTPVWAGSYVPVLNTFFDQVSLSNKKIALFCCYAGSEGKTFQSLKMRLKESEIIGKIGFQNPAKNKPKESIDRAKAWAADMVQMIK